jgi:hypothetical protein
MSLIETYVFNPIQHYVDVLLHSVGYPAPMPPFQVAFDIAVEGNIDTTDVLAYIATNFSGWTP